MKKLIGKSRILRYLFRKIWENRLRYNEDVVEVRGWKSALVDRCGSRQSVEFMIKMFGKYM